MCHNARMMTNTNKGHTRLVDQLVQGGAKRSGVPSRMSLLDAKGKPHAITTCRMVLKPVRNPVPKGVSKKLQRRLEQRELYPCFLYLD